MHTLEIYDLTGRHDASSPEQLRQTLSRRFDGGNHFEIAAAGMPYPMLALMVRDDLAVVHYLPGDQHAGSQSIGDMDDAPDLVEFPENLAGAVFTMPGTTVIATTTAVRCAEDFSLDLQRPTAIAWLEL